MSAPTFFFDGPFKLAKKNDEGRGTAVASPKHGSCRVIGGAVPRAPEAGAYISSDSTLRLASKAAGRRGLHFHIVMHDVH